MWETRRKEGLQAWLKTERVVKVTGMPSPESRRNECKYITTK